MILLRSLGLSKLYRDLQLPLILLILVTEVQTYLFMHPYFQVYILGHMLRERETDGKLRAFRFVERVHLERLWSYKAIKEEIKILHSRLVRITRAIKESEHSRHLINEEDDEDDVSLLGQDKLEGLDLASTHQTAADLVVQHHSNGIESRVIEMIGREGEPVVSLKRFMQEFHSVVKEKQDDG